MVQSEGQGLDREVGDMAAVAAGRTAACEAELAVASDSSRDVLDASAPGKHVDVEATFDDAKALAVAVQSAGSARVVAADDGR